VKKEAAQFSKMLASYCNATWHQNSEDLDSNLHCCEKLIPYSRRFNLSGKLNGDFVFDRAIGTT